MQLDEKTTKFNYLLRQNVKNYFIKNEINRKGGTIVILKAFMIVSFLILSYVMMLTLGSSSRTLLYIFFFITLFFQLMSSFAVMHDASHNALSKSKWINMFVTHTLLSLGGVSASIWRYKHVVGHHIHTNVSTKDLDIDGAPFFVFSKYQKRRNFHRFQYIYALFFYCLLSVKWIMYDDFRDMITNVYQLKAKQRLLCLVDTFISRAVYLTISIIIPILIFHSFLYVMLFWCLYNALFSIGLTLVFQCAHVNTKTQFFSPESDKTLDFSTQQVASTVDYAITNPILTAYLGGLNFQVIHHLFPAINHRHYPAIQKILIDTLKQFPLIKYNQFKYFSGAITDHFRYLKNITAS